MCAVEVIKGDITTLHVDAIINAANPALRGGGGVDGAIHRAAGPELLAACQVLPVEKGRRCPTGEARITPGFRLAASYVIHTVGPIWKGGQVGEAEALASCYQNAMMLARAHGVKTLAFPAISCGVYGYPVAAAGRIALHTTFTWQQGAHPFEVIYHVCFGDAVWQAFLDAASHEAR